MANDKSRILKNEKNIRLLRQQVGEGGGGSGLPDGGTADQVLAKIDATDGNADWVDPVGEKGDTGDTGDTGAAGAAGATGAAGSDGADGADGVVPPFEGVRVITTSSHTITSSYAPIDWDVADFDTNAFWEGVTNPDRITVPTGVTYMSVFAGISDTSSVTGDFKLIISHYNAAGTELASYGRSDTETTGADATTVMSGPIAVTATDYFLSRAAVSGSSRTLDTSGSTFFSAASAAARRSAVFT